MTTSGLSKTKIISGLQCPKRLYLQVRRPDEAETGGGTDRLIQFGYRVQEVARGLYPKGELVGHETALREAIRPVRCASIARGTPWAWSGSSATSLATDGQAGSAY